LRRRRDPPTTTAGRAPRISECSGSPSQVSCTGSNLGRQRTGCSTRTASIEFGSDTALARSTGLLEVEGRGLERSEGHEGVTVASLGGWGPPLPGLAESPQTVRHQGTPATRQQCFAQSEIYSTADHTNTYSAGTGRGAESPWVVNRLGSIGAAPSERDCEARRVTTVGLTQAASSRRGPSTPESGPADPHPEVRKTTQRRGIPPPALRLASGSRQARKCATIPFGMIS